VFGLGVKGKVIVTPQVSSKPMFLLFRKVASLFVYLKGSAEEGGKVAPSGKWGNSVFRVQNQFLKNFEKHRSFSECCSRSISANRGERNRD